MRFISTASPPVRHLGGYSRFECDVTSLWQSDQENEIIVKATDDDLPYQTYGKQGYGNIRGIWQTVYLEERPPRYIDRFTITTRLDGTVAIACSDAGEGDLLGFEADFKGAHAASGLTGIWSCKLNSPGFGRRIRHIYMRGH